jgi:hypothetical protein
MTSPPGADKTLIAKSFPGILPRMSIDEALEVSKIYGVADLLPADMPLMRQTAQLDGRGIAKRQLWRIAGCCRSAICGVKGCWNMMSGAGESGPGKILILRYPF